ncbi:MAG TPA: ABC transporter ATP-binding protein [Actinomycetota bacterium]|nr:ABC transporter ATP-binding protein [Actinomycetota bacterium]
MTADVQTAPSADGGLRLRELKKRFADVEAVRGVDLDLPSGKLVSFLGPSGCGKTTLLRMIAGLERPTEGRIFLGGEDITDRPAHRRDIGMVFQTLALFPHLSVAGNIGYAMRIRGVAKEQIRRRVEELLGLVSLEGLGDRRVSQLSGGQRQRVATARALALEPRLFLLDEPLSALDANLREQLQVELRLLQQKLGITTIMVTHDQREAMTMSDLVVVMRDGRVEQVGEALDVYRRPATAFVARFVGSSNLLRGTAVASDRLRLGDHDVRVGGTALTVGAEVTVSLRPEEAHLRLDERAADGDNVLSGTVVFMRDLGELFECYVDVGLGDPVIVAGSPRERIDVRPGDRTSVAFAPDACVVVEEPS